MQANASKPPTFHQASTALDPTVTDFLSKNDLLVQSGVKYSEYVKIRPNDGLELTQNSRFLNFLHHFEPDPTHKIAHMTPNKLNKFY